VQWFFFYQSEAENYDCVSDNQVHRVNPVESKTSLTDDLADWAVKEQITHAGLRRLLKILGAHYPESNLSHDPRTLLNTVRT